MCVVGNLTGQGISVGKLPGPFVGTLQGPLKTVICRNFAYASWTWVVNVFFGGFFKNKNQEEPVLFVL